MSNPRGTVGASDVAALFGEHPYLSEYALWARESGMLRHAADETTDRQQIGLDLEPAILAAWGRDEGQIVDHNRLSYKHPAITGASATPDGLVSDPVIGRVCATAQIKTVQTWERSTYLAGVPRHHFLQVQQEIGCFDVKRGYLICQFGFNERAHTVIERDEATQEEIAARVAAFWKRVAGELPPPSTDGHRATLAAQMARRRERRIVDFGDPRIAEMMTQHDAEYREARAARIAAEKREARAKAAILNALSDADAGTFADGSGYRVETIMQQHKAKPAKSVIVRKLTRFTSDNTESGDEEQ